MMNLEEISNYKMDAAIQVMAWVRLILLVLASAYGIKSVWVLFKTHKTKPIYKIKKTTFCLLTSAVTLFALGILMLQIMELLRNTSFPSIADIPLVLSHALFIVAFVYFWLKTTKMDKLVLKEWIFFFAVCCAVALWLIFIFKTAVVSSGVLFADILYWYYPIAASLMFLSTLVVNPRLKASIITTPLWYISSAVFLHFVAFIIHYYTLWNPISYFVPSIYSLIYVLSAGLFVIGFFTASKNYR